MTGGGNERLHDRIERWAPGLAALLRYRTTDLVPDIRAGVAVAAVSIPVAIAYAGLAGFPPEVGLYSCLLPLVVYALLGSSRQLVLGPDAATCAVIAAAIAPMAAGDPALYASMSASLALLTGLICIAASFLRLGAMADFLSKPILVGFMNGIAATIILGQLGKVVGIPLESSGFIPTLVEIIMRIGEIHWPTVAVGVLAFAVIIACARLVPKFPSAIAAMAVCAAAAALLGLGAAGVATLDPVPPGLPAPIIPSVDPATLARLLPDAAGLALISFTSMMLTSRSFASKNGYDIDPDKDFTALGAANTLSAFSQGFAVSGADSRTAMSDASGGRTHATGLFAAAAIAIVLLFFTGVLQFVPIAALGAVLVAAGVTLIDTRTVRRIWEIERSEATLSLLATIGVVALGATQGILIAVALSILRFVRLMARPQTEILGKVEGMPGFHSLERHKDARTSEGVVIFRFNGPLVFFNAGHFRRELATAAEGLGSGGIVVVDMLPITRMDVTGLLTFGELARSLRDRGIRIAAAGRRTEWQQWMADHNVSGDLIQFYPTLKAAVKSLDPQEKGGD